MWMYVLLYLSLPFLSSFSSHSTISNLFIVVMQDDTSINYSTMKILKWDAMGCFSHPFHLAVMDSCKAASALFNKLQVDAGTLLSPISLSPPSFVRIKTLLQEISLEVGARVSNEVVEHA